MPFAIPLLPELGALVTCLVALGICLLAAILTAALFKVANTAIDVTVGWVPWLGGKVKKPLHSIEQRLNNYMAEAVTGTSYAVARTWHALAISVDFAGKALVSVAEAVWRTAWYVEVKFPLKVISALVHQGVRGARTLLRRVEHTVVRVQTIVRVISQPAAGPIAAGVKWGTKMLSAEIARAEHWIGVRGKWLEHEVAVAIPGEIANLRDWAEARTRTLGNAWKRIRALEHRLGSAAIVGAIAFALARLGAGWVRCTNVRRVGRRLCGMDSSALEDILLGTTLILGSISIVEFAKELQGVMGEAERGIRGFIRETR